jgi:hypothetical protein
MPNPHKMLGRIHKPDPRDMAFLMETALPKRLPAARRKAWGVGDAARWDQWETSRCVSFGWNRLLVAKPTANQIWYPPDLHSSAAPAADPNPLAIVGVDYAAYPGHRFPVDFQSRVNHFYDVARILDGIPMPHEGTTVRAGGDALLKAGVISGYQWAHNAVTMARFLLTLGPVVAGVDWTSPMFSPITYGKHGTFVRVDPTDSGRYDVVGGHCICIYAVDLDGWCPDGSIGWAEAFNSWGPDWGRNGTFRMSLRDWGVLAANNGEFCAPTEVKLKGLPRAKWVPRDAATDIEQTV